MPRGYITFAGARATQAEALEGAIGTIADEVRAQQAAGAFAGPGPIIIGIGASYAAASAPVWTMRSRGIHSWRLSAGDQPLPYPASVHPIIAISQSGKSTETLAVLQSIDPALRYAVVNSAPSPIADLVERHLSLGNIPDSYASTIGYTATIAGLGMIADSWDGGTIDGGWSVLAERFRETEAQLADRASELAATFDGVTTADFVGGGPSVGSAEAGALLFREVARVHSAGMSTRQYLHGSMESAGEGVHVLFGHDRELEVARTLSGAGHRVILITTGEAPQEELLQSVRLPAVPPSQLAVLEAVVLQALVGQVAHRRGVDIEEFVFHNSDTKVEDPVPDPSRADPS
jgi:glucosamine--fructose-6-phosphate aminotransferase (isomerizing)